MRAVESSSPEPSGRVAVDFLRRFHPTTPWAICAFGANGQVGPARTFVYPGEEDEAERFIERAQGDWNLYFSVNVVKGKPAKKVGKAQIEQILWLHVDADLDKKLDWSDLAAVEAERDRVLAQLRAFEPRPTAIVWSGGGYQGFWRLSEPIAVNGNAELMRSAERRMARIAKLLGGDACQNADRVMRLPGTINVLNGTKIAAGRKPAWAEVVEFDDARVHDLEDFCEPTAPPRHSACRANARFPDGEIERISDALRHIPSDDYDTYLDVCMAVKSALGDSGFAIARDWAMTSSKFEEAEFGRKWASVEQEGGVTVATLFRRALDNGWRNRSRANAQICRNGASAPEGGAHPPALGQVDGHRRTQASQLIELVSGGGGELFHAPDGTAYADIVIDGHRETWPLKSQGFRRWLQRAYYIETGGAPNGDAMATAMGVLEARAHFDGVERTVCLRVSEHGERIYLDLCDTRWRAVEIDANGWRIVDAPPVRFRRTAGMLPLPEPLRGGSVDELRKHLHVDDGAYVLAVSWLLAILRGRGPYPILALTGEQGTGKSLTGHQLRLLVDPHSAPLRSLPRDTRDLYVAAINGHVLVFDNLSSIPTEMSDALCRLSTGGGFSTRALYTNDSEVIFDGQRPIALTSITDVASRSDLADRLLLVRLEVIPDTERRTEAELHAVFTTARPRILGALLDVVVHGLIQLPQTRLNRLPRMADYAVWMRACETAIWSAGMHLALTAPTQLISCSMPILLQWPCGSTWKDAPSM
jgi:hypothetical protein